MIRKLKNKLYQQMGQENSHTNNTIELATIQTGLQELKVLQGKQLAIQNQLRKETILSNLNEAEFKVFSQWGDDGIIQFLVDYLDIENKVFVEFGVENYLESNTRFLLLNNCWKGLVMDGSIDNINQIKKSNLYWQYQLDAICCFITKENINQEIANYIKNENLGLLVIDLDGNDYWIWEAIEHVKPTIVIVEYNSLFGNKKQVTIPYKPDFRRSSVHYSNLYYGASLAALNNLANKKDYALVACNTNGNNAFFVRRDKMKKLKELQVEQAYKQASFRESRDTDYKLTYLNFNDACLTLKDLSVFNLLTGIIEPL
jgi:hypothetical protein